MSARCPLPQTCATEGLIWEGRAHSGLDDALNTARLAVKLLQSGVKLRVTESFAEAPPPAGAGVASTGSGGGGASSSGNGQKPAALAPMQSAQLYDGAGRWLGVCKCGVKAHVRVTKKPGPNHGRAFYSCGRWTITGQRQQCDFFKWQDELVKG